MTEITKECRDALARIVDEVRHTNETNTRNAGTEYHARRFVDQHGQALLDALYAAEAKMGAGPGKYDEVLVPFSRMMEAELHANSGKGDRPGWLAMTRQDVLLEIHYHLAKLQKAALKENSSGIREHAADVANMCMMAVDICGAWPTDHGPTQNAAPPAAEPVIPTHRHKKRGTEYVLIGIGKMQAELWFDGLDEDMETTVDMREVAIYRSVDDGSLWVRPREEFEDGRFEDLRPEASR